MPEDKVRNIVNCMKPYILRRESSLVEKTTPSRQEYLIGVNMTKMQEQYLKFILDLNQTTLKYATEAPKLNNVLIQLKKVCNHPFMFKDDEIAEMTLD